MLLTLVEQPNFKHKTSRRVHVFFGKRVPKSTRTVYNVHLCKHTIHWRNSHFYASCRGSPHLHPRNVLIFCPGQHIAIFGGSGPWPQSPLTQRESDLVKRQTSKMYSNSFGDVWTWDTALYGFNYLTVVLIHTLCLFSFPASNSFPFLDLLDNCPSLSDPEGG